jgi:16S rRNA processing protein RimM
MATEVPSDLVAVGHITGAYGVQGWVRIHPYSTDAAALLHAKTWWFSQSNTVHDVEKLEAKRHGDGVVASVMGVVGRDAAENLKGTVIQIRRSHFPVLAESEFYWCDLIGLAVENVQGESLGTVANLIDNGAHPILRVVLSEETSSAREFLIPFVDRFVPSVDQHDRKIIVDWGLDY